MCNLDNIWVYARTHTSIRTHIHKYTCIHTPSVKIEGRLFGERKALAAGRWGERGAYWRVSIVKAYNLLEQEAIMKSNALYN